MPVRFSRHTDKKIKHGRAGDADSEISRMGVHMELQILKKTILFQDMEDEEIKIALERLKARKKNYRKGEPVFLAGTTTQTMGLVLDGSVTIENNDVWGNRTILSHIGVGQFFAETYALLSDEPLMVDAVANEDCTILFLYLGTLPRLSASSEPWLIKLITHLLMVCAHKNLTLSNRSFHTAPKTIRGRVMAYLNAIALRTGSREFDIPFDRQQLADYLNLERSALSKELGKMQRDGLITVRKNHFILTGSDMDF